jgi:PAS domain-containing protein
MDRDEDAAPARPPLALDGLARDLAAGRTDTLGALFGRHGAAAPVVIWAPTEADFAHPAIRAFARLCIAAMDDMGRVPRAAFEAADLSHVRDWLMLVDVEGAGADFRYAHYGAEIRATYQRDMTGACASAIGGHVSAFFVALYRAALARRQWALSLHEPPPEVFARRWQRLIVPLDEGGRITRFAVLNVAENELRMGLEALPDPMLVARADGGMLFANRAARRIFGERSFQQAPVSLPAYSGLDIRLGEADGGLPATRRDSRAIAVADALIVHFTVTTSPLYYRDRLCWLVALRPS